MDVSLFDSTGNFLDIKSALRHGQNCARVCYSEKDIVDIQKEIDKPGLLSHLLNSGHQSVFDHFHLNFYFDGVPKIMVMILNNEPPYATSEKSARYTVMNEIDFFQKKLYDKWFKIFRNKIDVVYSPIPEGRKISDKQRKLRNIKITKLAQENARYLTSVFTPAKMVYTLSLRHMNELAYEFEEFVNKYLGGDDLFKSRLAQEGMIPFLESEVVSNFRVPEIKYKGGKKLSFFGQEVEELFGRNVYSTNSLMSFACFAQAQRHRTTNYCVSSGWQVEAPKGYFIPPIIFDEGDLADEWIRDLMAVSDSGDFPQAQSLLISETGTYESLMSKSDERLCGLAQLEVQNVTCNISQKYDLTFPADDSKDYLCQPPCKKAPCDRGGCVFGKKALERRV
jgi:hypothetical protein